MTRFALVLVAAGAMLLSACSTIHFKNGDVAASGAGNKEMHHTVVNDIFTLSKPVDMTNRCDGRDWSRITNELTFMDWAMGFGANFAIGQVVSLPFNVWQPYTVSYACSR